MADLPSRFRVGQECPTYARPWPIFRTRNQSRFHRILPDVFGGSLHLFVSSTPVIEIFVHPKVAIPSENAVGFACRATLEDAKMFVQQMVLPRHVPQQKMDVVRHECPTYWPLPSTSAISSGVRP